MAFTSFKHDLLFLCLSYAYAVLGSLENQNQHKSTILSTYINMHTLTYYICTYIFLCAYLYLNTQK